MRFALFCGFTQRRVVAPSRNVGTKLPLYAAHSSKKHRFYRKVKVRRKRPEGPEGGRSIALLFLDLGARRGWVVSTTPRPLYPRERLGTHSTGGWVGPKADLDVCGKISPLPGF